MDFELEDLGLDPKVKKTLNHGGYAINLSWLECRTCHFLTRDPRRIGSTVPCGKCGDSAAARLYPSSEAIQLLTDVQHFYKSSFEALERERNILLAEVSAITGRRFNFKAVFESAEQTGNLYRDLGGARDSFDNAMLQIKESLGLGSVEASTQVFYAMFNHINEPRDDKAVLILSASLLELLSIDLIKRLYLKKGVPPDLSSQLVERIRTHAAITHEFKILAGRPLKEALIALGFPDFYDNWLSIKQSRDTFIHRGRLNQSTTVASDAFKLSNESFAVFASLVNTYAV